GRDARTLRAQAKERPDRRPRHLRPVPPVSGQRGRETRAHREMKSLPAFLLFCLSALPAAAQEPSLSTVLERAAAYVGEFHQRLSGIVAEERYVQEIHVSLENPERAEMRGPRHRALTSDLL